MTDSTPEISAHPETQHGASSRPRDYLAQYVVIGSFLTLFLLIAAVLGVAQLGGKETADLADKTFTTVLPVLAGWVGAVLAFYFSAQSP
jgi:hypothetical protein